MNTDSPVIRRRRGLIFKAHPKDLLLRTQDLEEEQNLIRILLRGRRGEGFTFSLEKGRPGERRGHTAMESPRL